jgi:hypothetical protein
VHLPLPGDSKPLVLGQVVDSLKPNGKPVAGKKNDPMMPVAWVKTYKGKNGEVGRVFTTTMGASRDLLHEGTRRMLVQACYWAIGMEDKIPEHGVQVDIVGAFKPRPFAFNGYLKGVKPSDHAMSKPE